MTTTGGPQDAGPQDAVDDGRPTTARTRPPGPSVCPALGWLVGLHLALVLALVVAGMSVGSDRCASGTFCLTRGDMAGFAAVVGGAGAALSLVGGTAAVLLLTRRVRGTGSRVVLGVVGGALVLVLVGGPLARPFLGL